MKIKKLQQAHEDNTLATQILSIQQFTFLCLQRNTPEIQGVKMISNTCHFSAAQSTMAEQRGPTVSISGNSHSFKKRTYHKTYLHITQTWNQVKYYEDGGPSNNSPKNLICRFKINCKKCSSSLDNNITALFFLFPQVLCSNLF